MKKFNLLILLGVFAVLTGCSETPYAPNAYNGALQNPYLQPNLNTYPQPGIGTNNIVNSNPTITTNPQIAASMQMNAGFMFSCNMRARPNFFYMPNPRANCAMMRGPVDSPARCACYQAPCNCQVVLADLRRIEEIRSRTPQRIERRSRDHRDVRSSDRSASDLSEKDLATLEEIRNRRDLGTSPAADAKIANEIQDNRRWIGISGPAAEALYKRLRREISIEEVSTGHTIAHKIGTNLGCFEERRQVSRKKTTIEGYRCDFAIDRNDGTILILSNTALASSAIIPETDAKFILAEKDGLTIGAAPGSGLYATESRYLVEEGIARNIYRSMNGLPKKGLINGNIVALIKQNEKGIRCWKAENALQVYGCEIRFDAATGDLIAPLPIVPVGAEVQAQTSVPPPVELSK